MYEIISENGTYKAYLKGINQIWITDGKASIKAFELFELFEKGMKPKKVCLIYIKPKMDNFLAQLVNHKTKI